MLNLWFTAQLTQARCLNGISIIFIILMCIIVKYTCRHVDLQLRDEFRRQTQTVQILLIQWNLQSSEDRKIWV